MVEQYEMQMSAKKSMCKILIHKINNTPLNMAQYARTQLMIAALFGFPAKSGESQLVGRNEHQFDKELAQLYPKWYVFYSNSNSNHITAESKYGRVFNQYRLAISLTRKCFNMVTIKPLI